MIIKAVNNITTNVPLSYLSSGEVVGTNALRVKNVNVFSPSWAVQIGATGEAQSEIKVLGAGAITGTSVSITGTTNFNHPSDLPVYAVKYDQIVFERSTSGTAGTAIPISSGTVNITPNLFYTQFDDTTGAASYAYKVYYYNSVTSGSSTESDWLTSSGFTFYSLAKLRDRVKRKLFSANYIKDDQTIDDWTNEWLEKMNNVAIDVNKDYVLGSTSVAFSGTAELGTITAADFKEIRRVWMTQDGSNYYVARQFRLTDYIPQEQFNDTHPYFYMKGDNVIGRKPATASGTASIDYYKIPSVLATDTDELPVVMHAYSKSFVDYVLSQAYYLDNKMDMGDRYKAEADKELANFMVQITPRMKTGPQSITISEAIDADDNNDLFI